MKIGGKNDSKPAPRAEKSIFTECVFRTRLRSRNEGSALPKSIKIRPKSTKIHQGAPKTSQDPPETDLEIFGPSGPSRGALGGDF